MKKIVLIFCISFVLTTQLFAADYIIKTVRPAIAEVKDSKGKVIVPGQKKVIEYTQLIQAVDETDRPVIVKDRPVQVGMEQAIQNIRQLEVQLASNEEQYRLQDSRFKDQLNRWQAIKAELEK